MARAQHTKNSRASIAYTVYAAAVILFLAAAGCRTRPISANPSSGTSNPPTTVAPAPRSGSSTGNTSSAPVNPRVNPSPASPLGNYSERGVASWYGVPFHGRRAADGEIYDMYKMTAAHRTLPFDTVVRVTNLANGLHTDVRIIDRGPFVEDRVIDLSLAAARALGMVGTGTAMVTLEVISSSSTSSAPGTPGAPVVAAGTFAVQVGAFSDRGNADRLKDQLAARIRRCWWKNSPRPPDIFSAFAWAACQVLTPLNNWPQNSRTKMECARLWCAR